MTVTSRQVQSILPWHMRAAFQRDTLTELFPPHIIANLRDKWTFVHFIVAEDWRSNTDSMCYFCVTWIFQGQADYRLFSANYIFKRIRMEEFEFTKLDSTRIFSYQSVTPSSVVILTCDKRLRFSTRNISEWFGTQVFAFEGLSYRRKNVPGICNTHSLSIWIAFARPFKTNSASISKSHESEKHECWKRFTRLNPYVAQSEKCLAEVAQLCHKTAAIIDRSCCIPQIDIIEIA